MAMTDEQLKQLVADHLKEDGTALVLGWLHLDDDDLRRLVPMIERLPGLQRLYLSGNNIGDAGAARLAQGNLSGLQTLYLSGNNIGAEGAADLRASLPGCTLYV